MENPFESGHIKNYIFFYASVVVIIVLFFIASTLFNEIEEVDKKVFKTDKNKSIKMIRGASIVEQNLTRKFKLLDKVY